MIELRDVNKSYGREKILSNIVLNQEEGREEVLADINLNLEDGKIYGLLGRNGVGKSTLLNLIGNQIRMDSGSIRLDGEELYENSKGLSDICLVKESPSLAEDIKVNGIFKAASILYKNWNEDYKDRLVEKFGLSLRKKYHKLSRGNQTLVGLIIGLASRARFTFFDEPSLGLDAAHRDLFYRLLLEDWEENPRTILISTHLIDEAANLFEEIIILKERDIYLKEEVSSLMEKGHYLRGREEDILSLIDEKKIIYRDNLGTTSIVGVFDYLDREKKEELGVKNIDISPISLQKLFIHLTENSLEGEEV